jgi:transposase
MYRFRIKMRGKTVRKFPETNIQITMEIIKQSVGIDVSKGTLDVIFKSQTPKGVTIKGSRKFDNTHQGFEQLLAWCNKREATENVIYVMEATGIYHEDLLFYLHQQGKQVAIELPQRIKYYSKSKGIKTKNDTIDSGVIADYGIERNLTPWQPPSPKFQTLRDLSREHTALTDMKTVSENRLHAALYSHDKTKNVIARLQAQIEFCDQQLGEIGNEITAVIKEDEQLNEKIGKVKTIKGIGLITIVKILAETGGFYLFNNINQLISYAGLDVVENQSGTHQGKTRISKKGNTRLRTALYMPALSAIRHNKEMKEFNERIMETHQFKKQGIVAVMRKLLILVYTLWKKNEEYDYQYVWHKQTTNFG